MFEKQSTRKEIKVKDRYESKEALAKVEVHNIYGKRDKRIVLIPKREKRENTKREPKKEIDIDEKELQKEVTKFIKGTQKIKSLAYQQKRTIKSYYQNAEMYLKVYHLDNIIKVINQRGGTITEMTKKRQRELIDINEYIETKLKESK